MKKYELLKDQTVTVDGQTLYRIRALRDFGNVKAGDLGGWIASERNLTHGGNAWVAENARAYGNARVSGNAAVSGNAHVFGNAKASGRDGIFSGRLS